MTFHQGHPMSHYLEGLHTGYLLAKFIDYYKKLNIVKNDHKWIFSDFQEGSDLDLGQGHPMSHHFEGLPIGFLLAKFNKFTTNI